nr:hypothetical protein [Tanacetum cinerariifolium]
MISDEGIGKTKPLPERPRGPDQSTRLRYRSLTKNKGNTSSEVESDTRTFSLITVDDVQALLLSDEELMMKMKMMLLRLEMKWIKTSTKLVMTTLSLLNTLKSHPLKSINLHHQTRINLNFPKLRRLLHQTQSPPFVLNPLRPMITTCLSLKGNWAAIEGYYEENVDHMDQTNKLIKETMKTIDNISKAGVDERTKLLKALNRVSKTLEANFSLKKEMKNIDKSHNTTFGNLSSFTRLLNNAKLPEILTKMNVFTLHSTL